MVRKLPLNEVRIKKAVSVECGGLLYQSVLFDYMQHAYCILILANFFLKSCTLAPFTLVSSLFTPPLFPSPHLLHPPDWAC